MELQNLNTNFLARNIIYFEAIDSTQAEVWRRIKNKTIKNGDLIIAELQTKGVGTHGKTWYTDEKNNIAFSFYIEANCNTSKMEGFTREIAETIVEVFQKLYKIELQIKQPNDIVFFDKKIGGILTETKSFGEKIKNIVIGIGINTNKSSFNKEINELATSVSKEFKIKIDNSKVISKFVNLIEPKIIKRIGE